DTINKAAVDGYPISPDLMGRVEADVTATGSPELRAGFEHVQQMAQLFERFRKMSPLQLNGAITDLRAQGAEPAVIKGAEALYKNMTEAIKNDMVGWADRTGMVSMPPLILHPQAAGAPSPEAQTPQRP